MRNTRALEELREETKHAPRVGRDGHRGRLLLPTFGAAILAADFLHERAEKPVVFKKREDVKKDKLEVVGALAFTALMFVPWVIKSFLTFMTVTALVDVATTMISGTRAERRKAEERLGITVEAKSKKEEDAEEENLGWKRLLLDPLVGFGAITGWRTLTVMPVVDTTRKNARGGLRAGLRAVSALVAPRATPSVTMPSFIPAENPVVA